jgi:hypothetical protein
MLLKLDEESGEVSAHVLKHLMPEMLHLAPMDMVDNRSRLVATDPTPRKDTVPHFRILAAARRPRTQALVESA